MDLPLITRAHLNHPLEGIQPPEGVQRKKHLFTLLCLALLFAAGCAGPLSYTYNPKPPEQITKLREPITVRVNEFTDARETASLDERGRRTIGRIAADTIVSDMSDKSLVLSEDIPKIITTAFIKELGWAGYTVKTGADAQNNADYVITGEIKAFSLDIGARDKISIAVSARLVDGKNGNTIWSDEETYENDRYAGSSGNSRLSITNYISLSLSRLVRKALSEASEPIRYTRYAPPALKEAAPATGKLVIKTDPEHGKVYLNEVYYGLTPLDSEIEIGIYDLTLKLDGFKDGKEKISVRKGQTTEIDMKLEKK